MIREKSCGFLLLEVVPALALISAILIISARMTLIRAGMEESIRVQEEAGEAFLLVWDNWLVTGGRAAVVTRDRQGSVHLLDFPDETWLPEQGGSGIRATSSWRRRIVTDAVGGSYWEIECRLRGAGGWHWWSRIRMDRKSAEG